MLEHGPFHPGAAMIGRIALRTTRQLQNRSLIAGAANARHCWKVSAFLRDGEGPSIFRRPFQHSQAQNISMSRVFREDDVPVKSPLAETPTSPEAAGASFEVTATPKPPKPKPKTVRAMLREIPQSPKKMNLVAKVVRGMRVNDALIQMSVLIKRAASTVYKVLHSARANAVHNYGFDAEKLIVDEAFVGKGKYLKRIWPHARGRFGIREKKRCRLTVLLREMTPKEEILLEKLREKQKRGQYIYRTKLLPHRLTETRWCEPGEKRKDLAMQTSSY
ncbi:50S ribosomal protein L22, chloroplastic [Selaginella moellendorffii]|nr:50S ribosomal protein L22, chloroplastic [Selaginella moellendorffii]|eukprot:XP_002983770.2 50S ribosomal protein L22, chloroplastic [Selaginella moellendorffii]